MPSWREYLQKSEYSLKNSKYFKGLKSLLNNDELISYAKDNGYKIVFKPHPNLANFIYLFDLNEDIIVDNKKHIRNYLMNQNYL